MSETKLDSFFATVQINLSGSRTPYRKEITRSKCWVSGMYKQEYSIQNGICP